MDHSAFANLSRDELINRARAAGVDRPELMTRVELADELVRRAEPDPFEQRRVRGWLGVARDLVASVVESGLNLPDAAALIRGERGEGEFKGPEPVATVTLAEIYATQGHLQRALSMLDAVIANEPEHEEAQRLRERLLSERPVRGARNQALALRYDQEVPVVDRKIASAEPVATPEPADASAQDYGEAEAVAHVEADAAPEEALAEAAAAAEADFETEPLSELEPVRELPPPEAEAVAAAEPVFEPESIAEIAPLAAFREEVPEPEPLTERPASGALELEPETLPPPTPPMVVLLRGADTDPVVCWDLGSSAPDTAEFAIVCVAFASTDQGVERNDLTVPITERRGRAVLESVPPAAAVRVALGVEEADGFVPVAVASELQLRDGVLSVLYRPPAAEQEEPTETESALVHSFAPGRSMAAGPLSL